MAHVLLDLRPLQWGLSLSAPQKVDWRAIEPHYRSGQRSITELADELGVSRAAIHKHAKANGWERDLKARVNAKADAKVAAAMVAAEVAPGARATEQLRVEVEAEVQARIRLTHRKDIAKFREHAMALQRELELIEDEKLPIKVRALKDLTDVTKTLLSLEREAFGLDGWVPPTEAPEAADPTDIARRLAFVLAAGMHAQPRMTQ